MVLDLTPGRLSQAIEHAEKALESVDARLADLRNGFSGQVVPEESEADNAIPDLKGKGKAHTTGKKLIREGAVRNMTKSQIETEMKELDELREDLALKVEELKTNPAEIHVSAPELAARALDRELNGSVRRTNTSEPAVVNDLTSMVVKKKKGPKAVASDTNNEETANVQPKGSKRKAEDDEDGSDKRAKVES